jgi:hypothetical protein
VGGDDEQPPPLDPLSLRAIGQVQVCEALLMGMGGRHLISYGGR